MRRDVNEGSDRVTEYERLAYELEYFDTHSWVLTSCGNVYKCTVCGIYVMNGFGIDPAVYTNEEEHIFLPISCDGMLMREAIE